MASCFYSHHTSTVAYVQGSLGHRIHVGLRPGGIAISLGWGFGVILDTCMFLDFVREAD